MNFLKSFSPILNESLDHKRCKFGMLCNLLLHPSIKKKMTEEIKQGQNLFVTLWPLSD